MGPNIRPNEAKANTYHGHRQSQDHSPTQTAKPGSQPNWQKIENWKLDRWPRQVISGYGEYNKHPQNKRINILKLLWPFQRIASQTLTGYIAVYSFQISLGTILW